MSNTEQMREAFERHMSDGGKFPKAVERSGDGYRLLQSQNAWVTWKACAAALTAPAAEVPEAMGEEQIVKCLVEASCIGVVKMSYDAGPYQITRPSINADKFARAIIAARDAQWQSTRLRGGVPDDESEHDVMMGMAADDQIRIETLTIHLRSVIEIARTWQPDYATKMDRDMLDLAEAALPALGSTAAPQAPAAALDAGVVRPLGCIKPDTDTHVYFYEQDCYVLSNFSAFRVTFDGQTFDTSEAAYHYQRFTTADDRRGVQYANSAHEAFRYAQDNKAKQRPDWDAVKVDTMRGILRAKAQQHEYVRRKLLATGDRILVEDSWRDDFWGWGPDRNGQNMLGKLWMEVRSELRAAMSAQAGKGGAA